MASSNEPEPVVTVQYSDPAATVTITKDPPLTTNASTALQSQTQSGTVLASPIFDIVASRAFTTPPVLRFKYDPAFDGDSLALYKYSVTAGAWIQVSSSYFVDLANNEIIITLNPDVFMGSLFALMKTKDVIPPVTGLKLIGTQYTTGGELYISGLTTISFNTRDLGGSGIAYTEYRLDDGAFTAYTAPSTIPEGRHLIEYRSADNAGNLETAKIFSLVVDKEAPVSVIAFTNPATVGPDGGFVVPYGSSVSFASADMPAGAASGVSDIWYSADAGPATAYAGAFALDVGPHTVVYWSTDNVGNAEAQKTALITVEPALKVQLKLEHSTLNLNSKGEKVTAKLWFEGSGQACFKLKTINISAINGLALKKPIYALGSKDDDDHGNDGKNDKDKGHSDGENDSRCGSITVKFDRDALAAVLPANAVSEVTVSGELVDGRGFNSRDTIRTKKPRRITRRNGGRFEHEKRTCFEVPAQALKADDDLYVLSVEGDLAERESRKEEAAKTRGMTRRGSAYEFGPEGSAFDKPVTISLPYAAEEKSPEKLAVAYWNEAAGAWEMLPSRRDIVGRLVKAEVPHFSQYQVVAASYAVSGVEKVNRFRISQADEVSVSASEQEFKLGEVYVFPNPAKGTEAPTFHIETGIADSVKITIYTVSGRTSHEYTLTGPPAELDDGNGLSYAYEYTWRGHIPTGVYLYYIEAQKAGQKLKKTGKFAVVR